MPKYDELAKFYFERRKNKSRFDYNRDMEVPAMIKALGSVKNKAILDLGCGFGDHAKKLSKKGAKKIIGLDISSKLIGFAKQQNIRNCNFSVRSMEKVLPFKNNTFDIVLSSLAIHYVKNLQRLFSEVHRVLKKGGVFAFSIGHPVSNLLNQSQAHMIGIKQFKGKKIIYGNYFRESKVKEDLGSLGWIEIYPYTYQTIITTALKNKFSLVNYVEMKPVPSSKKIDPEKYKVCTTLPTFVIFKWRK